MLIYLNTVWVWVWVCVRVSKNRAKRQPFFEDGFEWKRVCVCDSLHMQRVNWAWPKSKSPLLITRLKISMQGRTKRFSPVLAAFLWTFQNQLKPVRCPHLTTYSQVWGRDGWTLAYAYSLQPARAVGLVGWFGGNAWQLQTFQTTPASIMITDLHYACNKSLNLLVRNRVVDLDVLIHIATRQIRHD